MIEILSVQSDEALEQIISLSHEYITWILAEIPKHYPELDLSQFAAEHQYDDIRKKFPGEHVPPDGCLLIAMSDNQLAGCIAFGRLSESICEIRTLFVRPEFRGVGVGKKLVEASLTIAHEFGYSRARLDTLGFMRGALSLYQSLGFVHIEAYRELSDKLEGYIHFMEFVLE